MSEEHDGTSEANHTPQKDEGNDAPLTKTLRRSTTKKIFGGVAGGIAERFEIDANIVRVVFVVVALFYGLGIAIYLAMWVLIPRSRVEGSQDSEEEIERNRRHWLRYAVPAGVIVLAILVVAAVGHARPFVGGGFAFVWLVFLALVAIVALRSPASRLTLRRVLALGFLGVLSLLILVVGVFLVSVQVIGVPLEGGSGVKTWHPITTSEIQSSYHGAIGQSTINLVNVPFTSGTWTITATQGVGELIVEVPSNARVDLRTHVGIGNVQTQNVPWGNAGVTSSSPHLILNLQVGIGQIQYKRFVPCKATACVNQATPWTSLN